MTRIIATLLAFVLAAAAPAYAQTYNLTLSGASPGGLWSLLGAGVDGAVRAAYPGSVVTYQTSGGGIANIVIVDRGEAQMGLAHAQELKMALDGVEPFKAPVKSMRAIAYLYTWAPMHLIVTKDFADKYGLKSLADIKAKKAPARIAINKRGNIAGDVSVAMLEAAGITEQDLESWGGKIVYAASGEQSDLLLNRRIDMVDNSLFVGHSSVRKIDESLDVVMLSVPKDIADAVNAKMSTEPFTIPADSYKNQKEPVETITLSAGLVVNENMSDDDAYTLSKALYENIDKIQAVHGSMKALNKELMASMTVVPYHPGAVRYLKEAGLLKTN
ncbi:MAG: TAXI family TRAP transporter solute-binding subunit [Hyphomicrobiales bacterium]|nr:TAXI family TRAP transporter solute-binding subunit [Hyphomicrobiales bacterium]